MSLSRKVTLTAEDVILDEFAKIKKRLRRLENQHSPTVPIYDPDFPDDAVDGQFALASTEPDDLEDVSDAVPYFFWAEAWHPLIARGTGQVPYSFVRTTDASPLVIDMDTTDYYPWKFKEPDYDPDIYTVEILPVSPNGIEIHQAGLYLVRAQVFWFTDWGQVGLQTKLFPMGGFQDGFSVLGADEGDAPNLRSTYYAEAAGVDPVGFNLVAEQLHAITVPGDGYRPYIKIGYAGMDERETNAQMFVMRLSRSPYLNQS